MSPSAEPVCPRHDEEVAMRLRSLHSERSRPGQLMGLYECPDCGHEQRVPFAAGAEEVA